MDKPPKNLRPAFSPHQILVHQLNLCRCICRDIHLCGILTISGCDWDDVDWLGLDVWFGPSPSVKVVLQSLCTLLCIQDSLLPVVWKLMIGWGDLWGHAHVHSRYLPFFVYFLHWVFVPDSSLPIILIRWHILVQSLQGQMKHFCQCTLVMPLQGFGWI